MASTRTATVTAIPYRPSKLSQTLPPHSPIPILALETRTPSPHRPAASRTDGPPPSPPPPAPLLWLWTCHLCKRTYPLGATRRCLEDGHLFCAGVIAGGAGGAALRRRAACASEFDYAGWRGWGEWRRARLLLQAPRRRRRRCRSGAGAAAAAGCDADCDFPSQCRWVAAQALPTAAVRPSGGGWVW
jgi:hypothetical protein